jgi:hypothetical protein
MKKYLLFILIIISLSNLNNLYAASVDPLITTGPVIYSPSTVTSGTVTVSFDCEIGWNWLWSCIPSNPSWECWIWTCSKDFTSNTSWSVTVRSSNDINLTKNISYSVTNITVPIIPPIIKPPVVTPPIVINPPVETNPTCDTWPIPYLCAPWNPYAQNETSTSYTWSCANNLGDKDCSKLKTVIPPVVTPVISPVVSVWTWGHSKYDATAKDSIPSWFIPPSYKLVWCPSQKNLISWLTNDCKTQLFSTEWPITKIATLFIDGIVNTSDPISDWMAFKIIWEGKLTLETFISDKAGNIAKKQYVYLVDKTAPVIWDIDFDEDSPYIHALETESISIDLKRNQAVNSYIDTLPALSQYISVANIKNNTANQDIKKVRYKYKTNQNINIKLDNPNDNYWSLSTEISGLDRIEYLKGATLIKTDNNPVDWLDFNSTDFGISSNTWENINVRLYDNAWNYSEKAFYVYRDETPPLASSFDFNFNDNTPLKPSTWTNSKFILANTDTKIKYDWSISEDRNNHMAPGIEMIVENQWDKNRFDQISTLTTTNGTTIPYNLSKVDLDFAGEASGENYRNYSVQFKTPDIDNNKICDIVGNCVDGSDVLENFRVIANEIYINLSKLSIAKPDNWEAIANNPANANNPDRYSINYNLKDIHWNSIRQVNDWTQIKTVTSTFDFTNGLVAPQTPYSTNKNTTAVDILWLEWDNTNINNETDPKLVLKEPNNSSNWDFNFTLSSKVPTVGWYKYMKNSAKLSLDSITNNVVYADSTFVHNWTETNPKIDFAWGDWVSIESEITENSNNRYNLENDLTNYWDLNWEDLNIPLASNWVKLNFEFGSPFIYHAENFNILRDGINSKHTKKLEKYTPMNSYRLVEKYFDIENIDNNSKAFFYINEAKINNSDPITNGFNTQSNWTINEKEFNVKYDAIEWKSFKKWGYVSYLKYFAWWDATFIPSISRWIKSTDNPDEEPSAYFPDIESGTGWTNFLTQDIAISGLVNNKEWGANSNQVQPGQVSLDMKRPYTRAELLQKVKKKMTASSRGLTWCWSNTADTTLDLDDTADTTCTTTIQWEEISFYKWNVVLAEATIANKRTIIVKDGRVTIAWNLNTNGTTNGQLLIVSVTEQWLDNIEIINENTDEDKQKGWITIKQDVTNIDAFLLAQWPLVSSNVSDNNVFKSYDFNNKLLNQLHIFGSVFSLNTIGGSKTWECPYIEKTCSILNTAKIYDLSFLRRYALVDAGWFGWDVGELVPYDPSLQLDKLQIFKTTAKSSGGLQYYWNWDPSAITTLRTAKPEHVNAPVIIERDNRWNISPSFFAKD